MAIGQQIFMSMTIIIKLRMMRKPLEIGETPEFVMWSLFIFYQSRKIKLDQNL